MAETTYYWHDYETFGAVPSRDRPVQFAGLRTDADLNPIGEPLVVYSRPTPDYLPRPGACLVTGITPQHALEQGVSESEFITRIHQELSAPGTCGVGYNSIRFDDEVTRFTLYRNFFDPYVREYQNGNSRWDIIDMVRAAYALRPEGVVWPSREDGLPSFRLEDLTAANGIGHEAAHDALSDVHATIAVAGLIRRAQPRLFEYLSSNRSKAFAQSMLDIAAMRPVLHISGMFGAARANAGLIVPLAMHPQEKNKVLCYDLMVDPDPLLTESPETLLDRLFTRGEDLPEGIERPGFKTVHLNRCPVLLPAKMADAAIAERLGSDGDTCRRHLAVLREMRAGDNNAFQQIMRKIVQGRDFPARSNVDEALYQGFLDDRDKSVMQQVREASADELASASFSFRDKRLPELLFRYRARNFPESLSGQEQAQWQEHCFQVLTDPDAGDGYTLESFHQEIEVALADVSLPAKDREVLEALQAYGDGLLM